MMHGRNNGKKLMAVRIVAHAFEIVRLGTLWALWAELDANCVCRSTS